MHGLVKAAVTARLPLHNLRTIRRFHFTRPLPAQAEVGAQLLIHSDAGELLFSFTVARHAQQAGALPPAPAAAAAVADRPAARFGAAAGVLAAAASGPAAKPAAAASGPAGAARAAGAAAPGVARAAGAAAPSAAALERFVKAHKAAKQSGKGSSSGAAPARKPAAAQPVARGGSAGPAAAAAVAPSVSCGAMWRLRLVHLPLYPAQGGSSDSPCSCPCTLAMRISEVASLGCLPASHCRASRS